MGLKKEFSYTLYEGQHYPLVPVVIRRFGKSVSTTALIDSGANTSIFRVEIAEQLGLPLDRGKSMTFSGIAGDIPASVYDLELEVLENEPFKCNVAFSRKYATSFNILGRQGFFEKYVITLNEKERKVGLEG